ncbi:MAG: bifunctional 3'-5' exonuclease/DNA polymerase, partial [Leucobacter sp.]|nr:bifunctional 3'-5' exonuclease/DNA polymerase [Leucobacter sp.]
PRPATLFEKPVKLAEAGEQVREALGDRSAAIDSPPKLLRALRAAGVEVSSTSQWELADHDHPAIAPLLTYKKLARLLSANGWSWIDEWVRDGRYRPVYVPGGVVTGRWASSGGGALQLPRSLRPALRADPGWKLVTADVSQLEPRVLAAMSGDRAMAAAGRGKDLYSGIVESGSIESRTEAKLAMLGAMYGATSGESGRLVPRLRRAFPEAMRLVDHAADTGERGGTVTTWLGRSSPDAEPEWQALQAAATLPSATPRDEERARRAARDRGRFTRNFIVQGTAAEWALAWLAEIRRRLTGFDPVDSANAAHQSGPVFAAVPHLAFFLHDEIIVHTPAVYADDVAMAVTDAAHAAARLLFGDGAVDFLLDMHTSERAIKA